MKGKRHLAMLYAKLTLANFEPTYYPKTLIKHNIKALQQSFQLNHITHALSIISDELSFTSSSTISSICRCARAPLKPKAIAEILRETSLFVLRELLVTNSR